MPSWNKRTHLSLNYVNSKLLCIDNYYSGQKAIQELKLSQTPISIAIKEAVQWFENNENRN